MLPFHCPICDCAAKVIESRVSSNGTRRRRLACENADCLYRWTNWDGPRPTNRSYPCSRPGKALAHRFMTEERVLFILRRRDLSNTAAAKALGGGCSPEAVRLVRIGRICRGLMPDEPRWAAPGGITCHDCKLWKGECSIGLPDPEEEGIGFAGECSSFLPLSGAAAGQQPAAGAG
jgi:hypothetical protein